MKNSFSKKALFAIVIAVSTFVGCKNSTPNTNATEADKEAVVAKATNAPAPIIRHFQSEINKEEIIGTWSYSFQGSRAGNLIFNPNGSCDMNGTLGKWKILKDQLIFSNENATITANLDGSYMKIAGVAAKGGAKFEMEANKMDAAQIEEDKLKKQEEEKRERLSKFQQVPSGYKNNMFKAGAGFKMGIVLSDDGKFTYGEYDYNSNNQYVFLTISSEGTWEVINSNTIVLHNLYGDNKHSNDKFSLTKDRFAGTDILMLHYIQKSGELTNNKSMIFSCYLN